MKGVSRVRQISKTEFGHSATPSDSFMNQTKHSFLLPIVGIGVPISPIMAKSRLNIPGFDLKLL